MTAAEPKTSTTWPCALPGAEIECSPRALNAACTAAMTGLRKLAKGGLEVGGVLFGNRTNGLMRVVTTRPILCEHRFGPSFVLSDADRTHLAELLANFKSDPELASLEPLGCYFSHSRHGAALTDTDTQLFEQYFGDVDKVALLLIPNLNATVQVSLLARDAAGTLVPCHRFDCSVLDQPQTEQSQAERRQADQPRAEIRLPQRRAESTVPSRIRSAAKPKHSTSEIRRVAEQRVLPVQTLAIPVKIAPIAEAVKPAAGSANRERRRFFQVRSAILAGCLVVLLCWPNHAVPVTQIPLSFTDNGHGDLIIRWDVTPPSVRTAVLGMMDIRDGERSPVHVSIGPDLLQRGWLPYHRSSDLVRISFTLAGHGLTISDHAIYFAPDRNSSPPQPVEAKTAVLNGPQTGINTAAAPSAPVAAPPKPAVESEPEPQAQSQSSRVAETRKRPRIFRAPLEPVVKPGAQINAKPALLPEAPALRLDAAGASPLPLRASNFSLSAPRPSTPSPASGRLIWTGQLPKHSMLALSAQGASLGYVNGWIPKGPVHIEVRPGELIEGGMVVFTKEAGVRSEAPSLSNGWNAVMYKPDAARASEMEVLEAPGPANGWGQILLRNGARSLSVIIVDWRSE